MIQGKLNTRLNRFDTISLFVTKPLKKHVLKNTKVKHNLTLAGLHQNETER